MTKVIKLPKAPLQEAIFEIRWALGIDPTTNQTFDMGYSLAQGKLQEIVKHEFPVYKRKVSHSIPEQLMQYQTVNQYWKGDDTWPVLQLGPGIFTVNDTEKNYIWTETYFPLIKAGLNWIYKAYDNKLSINFASLRYVDSVKLNAYNYESRWQDFIHDHFNFSFVNNFNTRGSIKRIQFDQYFDLEDKSSLHISMNSGKYRTTDEDALIWQTAITRHAKFEKDSLIHWVDKVHTVTSDLFKELTKPNLYASFQ
jgi:uncharacterized protein (TIGR04255 family)